MFNVILGKDLLNELSTTLKLPPNTTRLSINIAKNAVVTAECTFDITEESELAKVLKKYELHEIPEEKGFFDVKGDIFWQKMVQKKCCLTQTPQ